jgi:hypothetical protein
MYVATFDGISVSAICELFYVKPASTRAVIIHEIKITQEISETSEQLPLQIARTATDQSAKGTSLTPAKLNVNGAASAGATVRSNILTADTFATLGDKLRVVSENVLGGWHELPTPETRIVLSAGGDGLVVKLKTAPLAALTLDGVLVFEEVG